MAFFSFKSLKFLTGSLIAGALLLTSLPESRADHRKVMAETQRFLNQHGFTPRLVTTGTPGQEIQRMVIPVTPSTAQDFAQRFSASKGFVRLREGYRDQGTFLFLSLTHDKLIHGRSSEQWNESTLFAPLKVESHYRASSRLLLENPAAQAFYEGNPASFAVPVHLAPSKMTRLKSWVNNIVNNRPHVEGWSNCMHLTTNAPLTDKLGLFGYLGIKRSKDGPNIVAKVMHASNKNICVVARYVNDQAELDNIPQGDLLGPQPYGGIEGAQVNAAGK